MIRLMVMVFTDMLMEHSMKDNGKMICNMEKGLKGGQMDLHIQECTSLARNKG